MKYKEWLREWLCHYIRPVAKEKTCRRYAEIAEKHLIPKLGDKDLCEITVQEAQWFVTDELQHGNQKTGSGACRQPTEDDRRFALPLYRASTR